MNLKRLEAYISRLQLSSGVEFDLLDQSRQICRRRAALEEVGVFWNLSLKPRIDLFGEFNQK